MFVSLASVQTSQIVPLCDYNNYNSSNINMDVQHVYMAFKHGLFNKLVKISLSIKSDLLFNLTKAFQKFSFFERSALHTNVTCVQCCD